MANKVVQQNVIDNNKRALLKYVVVPDGSATANSVLIQFNELRFALNANSYISNTDVRLSYGVSAKRIYGHSKLQAAGALVTLRWLSAPSAGNGNTEIVTFGTNNFDYDMGGPSGDVAVISSPDANTTGICMSITSPTNNDTFTLFLDLRKSGKDFDQGQTADPTAFNRGGAAGF